VGVYGAVVISIHVPKCAGTSFRNILSDQFGSRLWLNYGSIFTAADFRPELIPETTACIHGHFLGDAFDSVVPRPRYMTWVRHPVDRVVSNYYHCLRSPDLRDDCCRRLHEEKLSLRAFAELDWMQNLATRYLAGKAIETFDFVGIAERFDDSLVLLGRAFGWATPPFGPRENTNPDRLTPSYPLSSADYKHLLTLNQLDLKFYRTATARLDNALKVAAARSA
jgi:hypothetical protein